MLQIYGYYSVLFGSHLVHFCKRDEIAKKREDITVFKSKVPENGEKKRDYFHRFVRS